MARSLLAAGLMLATVSSPVLAQAAGSSSMEARTGLTLTLPINKSQTLRVPRAFARIAIGNPKIADVSPVTSTVAYLLGKEIGTTNLTMYDKAGGVIAVVDVTVTPDAMGLKQKLAEVMPTENLGVQVANDRLILSGTATSAAAAQRAMTIALAYAPDKVINMTGVGTAQQILLEVRFAEMQRGTVKALGIDSLVFGVQGDGSLARTTGTASYPGAGVTGTFSGTFNTPGFSFRMQALERQGLIRTLAQPNIIALSGETANFLAGGEFPVPVGVAINGQIAIEFKQFGVGLAFTPTLLEDGLINLLVAPEVSSLDPAAGIDIGSLRIPGLKVRRAKTTLELRDGQTFALAGLIQSDFRDTVNKIPLLGQIPILGALFRSSNFDRQETELVILVTPRIVRPVTAGTALQLPTDRILQPTDTDIFLLGKSERRAQPGTMLPLPGPASAINKPGGVAADHGHIVR
ncbi:type II and III secretion system protein family protein [Sandarakinorhabdus sp. AAP62]|uniref:type II and III secretion system protein family protein n=1 Tax=Sandarakinorhabdus sp. AAP62 TaxID=1248916 RepID=UPI00187BEC6D|nr:type II and III secretion system protein family protein [Sandarakinorhabdus sp. AAP62]